MLYKPASVYPHRDVVNPNAPIQFSCETMSNSMISKAQLVIDNGVYKHYYENTDDFEITSDSYAINVLYNYKHDNTISYVIQNKSYYRYNYNEDDPFYLHNNYPLSISAGKRFSWHMRLYEDASSDAYVPTSWIGGGVVDTTLSLYTNDDYSKYSVNSDDKMDNSVKMLKIAPHTNIPFKNATNGSFKYKNLYAYYDLNAKYYIRVDGNFYQILDYKFYRPTEQFDKDVDLDKYGTPLCGFAIIDGNANIQSGAEYNLYCNYIDTDTYYFETSIPPTLTLYEYFDNNNSPIKRAITSDKLTLNYSNLCIRGEYSQSEGASVSYYKVTLEEYINHDYKIIDISNNIYSPFIEYKYDRFLNNHIYRLTLSIMDSAGVTIEKVIDINVEYQNNSYPFNVKQTEYHAHNSMIIDFSELKSITGKEKFNGKHQFLAYDEQTTEIDRFLNYTANSCHLDKGNVITYDYIDGESDLLFGDSTYYLVCRIDSGYTGTIFEAKDDTGKIITLSWDGVYLHAKFSGIRNINLPNNQFWVFTYKWSPYEQWLLSHPTDAERISVIEEIFKNTHKPNYNIPFLYYENLPYDDSYYYHEETAFSAQSWAIVVGMNNGATTGYILCKNLTTDDDWTGVRI